MHQTVAKTLDVPSPRKPADCPVENWLTFLGHRWNALALWHLSTGPKRFSDLMGLLPGITPKTLSERLEGLVDRQLVARSQIATFPRGVVYHITERGREIIAILNQIEIWASTSILSSD